MSSVSKECGKPLDRSDVEYLIALAGSDKYGHVIRRQWFIDFAAKVSATLDLLDKSIKPNSGACQKCGDPLRHDDDGPALCRFCDQAHPETGGQAQGKMT